MEDSKIVDRIKKLLARAKLDVGQEADIAAATAARLIARYSIDEAVLADKPNIPREEHFIERTIFKRATKMPTWVLTLAHGASSTFDTWHTYTSITGYCSITGYGPVDAVESTEAMLTWLMGEVERLVDEAPKAPAGHGGKGYWTSFRNGAASKITRRLRTAKAEEREAMRKESGAPEPTESAPAAEVHNPEDGPVVTPVKRYDIAVLNDTITWLEGRQSRIEAWANGPPPGEEVKLGRNGKPIKKFTTVKRKSGGSYNGFNAGSKAGERASIARPAGRLPG